jgi:hypothetical protein
MPRELPVALVEPGQPGRAREDEADAHRRHRERPEEPRGHVVGPPEAQRHAGERDVAENEQDADVPLLFAVLRREDQVDGSNDAEAAAASLRVREVVMPPPSDPDPQSMRASGRSRGRLRRRCAGRCRWPGFARGVASKP